MSIYTPSCGPIPAYVCNPCRESELGGVRSIWLQNASYTFADISDPNEWATAICNQDVIQFAFTNGSVSMTANTSIGYGNNPTSLDSYTYEVEFHDPILINNGSGANGNVPFWDFIKNSSQWLIGWRTGSQIWLSSVSAQFTPTTPVNSDVKTKIDIDVKAMFVQSNMITPIAEPVGVFTSCLDC